MRALYQITTGELRHADTKCLLGVGYAGEGPGLNNPAFCDVRDVGPLPCGFYSIGEPEEKPNTVGHFALPLTPDPTNLMFRRGGFYVHGDNEKENHTASKGCIVIDLPARMELAAFTRLVVIP